MDTLMQSNLQICCITSLDGIIQQVSAAFIRTFKIECANLLGTSFAQLKFESAQLLPFIFNRIKNGEINEEILELDYLNNNENAPSRLITQIVKSHYQNSPKLFITIFPCPVQAEQRKNNTLQEVEKKLASLTQQINQAINDLRSPVSKIGNLAQFVHRTIPMSVNHQIDTQLESITNNIWHINSIISKLSEELPSLQKDEAQYFTTKDFFESIKIKLSDQLQQHSSCFYIGHLPDQLYGKREKLKLVFHHLLDNALKFRSKNQLVEILLSCKEYKNHWEFCLQDSGIGIQAEEADRIFEPGVQLNPTKTYQGAGMGLSICKKIVEEHKGVIELDTSFKEGSIFRFSIQKPKSEFEALEEE